MLKSTSASKSVAPAPKPKSKKKVRKLDFFRNEKVHRSLGVFLVLLAVYILISITSYLLTDFAGGIGTDNDTANKGFWEIITNQSLPANNWGGRLGTFFGWQLVKQGFGVASYLLIFLVFVSGIHLMLKLTILPYWRTLRYSLILMVWLSITAGFFLRETDYSILAGVFGTFCSEWLEGLMGEMGTGLFLLFVILVFLVFTVNLKPGGIFGMKKVKPGYDNPGDDSNGSQKNTPREDKFNTVEFAVNETEENSWDITKDKKKASPNELTIPPKNPEPATKPQKEIEFFIEQPVKAKEPEKDNFDNIRPVSKKEPEHFTVDTPYDPTLELSGYKNPTLDLLDDYNTDGGKVQREELEANKNKIVQTLGNYAIQIDKIRATIGPAVTLYEIIPAPGVRISRIKNLEDDIALSLSAMGIRIIAPIPGKGTIGIEVPNQNPEIVSMKSILASDRFAQSKYELPFGMGKTISNESFVADLTRMPHILMAGATGQGKSVGLNAVVASLLFKKHPAEVKFVMIDPKKVELTLFSKIERHFLAKLPDSEEAIITDTRKVVRTLNSLNIEMDTRYDLLKDAQVRNIKEYNARFITRKLNPNEGHRYLPYIVVVIDEFADLIMTAGKEIEIPLTRLAQLARAIGIHLIIATQRPSVNIITGSIKANFPARFAFRVISKIDSRTILDSSGAEQLIGRGDMLLSTGSDMLRLQCAFIDTHEIERITDFIGSQRGYPDAFHLPEYYDEGTEAAESFDPQERDEFFEDAARLIVAHQQGSTSLIQRKLKLGYNRAGRIIDQLEQAGIVGPFEGSKAREVKIANEMALEQFLKDLYSK